MDRTAVDLLRLTLHHKKVRAPFWNEAVAVAFYVGNRITTRALGSRTMPSELSNGLNPDLGNLGMLGSDCWYTLTPEDRDRKLGARAQEAMMIEYTYKSRGYKLLGVNDNKEVFSSGVLLTELEIIKHAGSESDCDINEFELLDEHTATDDTQRISATGTADWVPSDEPEPAYQPDDLGILNEHEQTSGDQDSLQGGSDFASQTRRCHRIQRKLGSWWNHNMFLAAACRADPFFAHTCLVM